MRPLQENDIFHAIAHPARRAILVTLKDGERAASELAEPFRMTFAAISQHLGVLEEARLVSVRRDGRRRSLAFRQDRPEHHHGGVNPAQGFAAERLPFTAAIGRELLAGDDRRSELLGQRFESRRLVDGRAENASRSASPTLPNITLPICRLRP